MNYVNRFKDNMISLFVPYDIEGRSAMCVPVHCMQAGDVVFLQFTNNGVGNWNMIERVTRIPREVLNPRVDGRFNTCVLEFTHGDRLHCAYEDAYPVDSRIHDALNDNLPF